MRHHPLHAVLVALSLAASLPALAEPAPFDLDGPTLEVKVTHGGQTLPIANVANLSPGDQLAIKADLPPDQSVHYLLVAAFLRGSTNPPPESWFSQAQTWTRKGADGLKITVPANAQQMLVFLAPETGGDFKTLINAVRGRPGAFVRASQDLNQASLDRSRLEVFLAAVNRNSVAGPDQLKSVSPALARSLGIKLNPDCFDKMPELQAACLTQGQDSLVLNDGHSTSIVEALTSGNSADLVAQLSASPQAGFGYYSPYIAAVMDIARIMDSFQTAQYQYIPALASARGGTLSLVLNTPPSFHNPLSVLVTALPAVEPPQAPPLRPVDEHQAPCAQASSPVLPVEGAPLVFSTAYAHDMVLRLKATDGRIVDLPVHADAEKGGLMVDTSGFSPAAFGPTLDGTLHGYWGFEGFDGPELHLQNARAEQWRLSPDDQQALVAGRDDTVHLSGHAAACVESVTLQSASGDPQPVDWKASQRDELQVTVPLHAASPGPLTLQVKQYGVGAPDLVPLEAYAQPGRLDGFEIHVGDTSGVLRGARLDEVAGLTLADVEFKPGQLTTAGGSDELVLTAADPQAVGKLRADQTATARIARKDGRIASLRVTVGPPRPQVSLISKSVRAPAAGASEHLQITDPDELPLGDTLTFSIRAEGTTRFSGRERVEVATADTIAAATTLTAGSGYTVEDPQVALITLDTAKAFGPSAFGALRFRVVDDGGAGDWRPLANLVRLPVLQDLKCPASHEQPCQLSGSDLFLIDALSNQPGFEHPAKVAEGFTGSALPVPHPIAGKLYLRLHDDPATVDQISFPSVEHLGQAGGHRASGSAAGD